MRGDARVAAQDRDRRCAGEARRPFDAVAARHRDGRLRAVREHAPDVAPIEVILIRRVDDLASIGRKGDVLDFELTRREQLRFAAVDGDRIKMRPAVLLPRKHDAIARGPNDLVLGHDAAIDAAVAFIRAPDLATVAGGDVGDADRPRLPRAYRREREHFVAGRDAREGDLLSVRRPDRKRVAVDARIEIANRLRREVVGADEGMLAARRYEGEL